MVDRFCPKCGGTNKHFFRGFCIECYTKDHELIVIPPKIEVNVCPSCLMFRIHGEWMPSTLENASKFVEEKVKPKQIDKVKILASPIEPTKNGALFNVSIAGYLGTDEIHLEQEVELIYTKRQCLICARKQSKYYKALIQIRPKDSDTTSKRMQSAFYFIRNQNRENAVKEREAEIFKFKKDKHGINVYFGSLRSAGSIVGQMKSKFGAEIKKSRSLFGMDRTGRKDYRTTYSVRI
ncbi:60S ribosomal export protein NMD3 [archaeon]|nr:60S ribosomal export protein NMD3 [archaeon]